MSRRPQQAVHVTNDRLKSGSRLSTVLATGANHRNAIITAKQLDFDMNRLALVYPTGMNSDDASLDDIVKDATPQELQDQYTDMMWRLEKGRLLTPNKRDKARNRKKMNELIMKEIAKRRKVLTQEDIDFTNFMLTRIMLRKNAKKTQNTRKIKRLEKQKENLESRFKPMAKLKTQEKVLSAMLEGEEEEQAIRRQDCEQILRQIHIMRDVLETIGKRASSLRNELEKMDGCAEDDKDMAWMNSLLDIAETVQDNIISFIDSDKTGWNMNGHKKMMKKIEKEEEEAEEDDTYDEAEVDRHPYHKAVEWQLPNDKEYDDEEEDDEEDDEEEDDEEDDEEDEGEEEAEVIWRLPKKDEYDHEEEDDEMDDKEEDDEQDDEEDEGEFRVGKFGKLEVIADDDMSDEKGAVPFDRKKYEKAMKYIRYLKTF